jgi:SRSO17 transposase
MGMVDTGRLKGMTFEEGKKYVESNGEKLAEYKTFGEVPQGTIRVVLENGVIIKVIQP